MTEQLRHSPRHIPPEVAYLALDLAQQQHRKPLEELDARLAEAILDEAQRRYGLERLILSSPEGHVSQVPESTLRDAEAKIRQRYDTAAELQADLARNGLDAAGLRAALHHSLRVEAVLAHIRRQAPEADELDARLYYQTHRNDFELPETRSASHLLITINPDFPENTRGNARRRIEALRTDIAREPTRWAELVQRHSECPSALQGGQMGRLRPGTLYPSLDQALFALPSGGLSRVLNSPLGLHLLRCDRIHPARVIEERRALPRIRALLTQRSQAEYERQWLAEIETANR